MQYVISFLEGIITFISPCLLPMLPIYISYFAGGGERTTRKTLLGALGFVSGFSVIFVAMGALAGTIGSFLREYQTMVNVISGLVVILFGLNFLGIFKWNLFRGGGKTVNSHEMGFFSAMLFGMNKKKIIMIFVLVFILILGGAGILYKQLGQKLAPDLLATQTPQETKSTETSTPTTQEDESEKILAPDFTVYDLDGNEVHLSDFIGKPVVLNFWASWCGPCKMEMPDFNEKYLEIGEEVQFLIINMTDDSRETVETASAFIAEQSYSFPVFYDTDQDAASTYGVYSIPTTYFIDADGNVIAQATGVIGAETLQQGIDMIFEDD